MMLSVTGVGRIGHQHEAERIEQRADAEHAHGAERSAIAPANGWPTPHSKFCSAKASANTSRPQPLASRQRRQEEAERRARPEADQRDQRSRTDDDQAACARSGARALD